MEYDFHPDPFVLLKQMMEASSNMNASDPQFVSYQNFTGSLQAVNKRDIFLKAQKQEKQTDWFKQLTTPKKVLKNGLTEAQEITIGLEMIPMFKAKEEEAKHEYDKLISVKQELLNLSEGLGIPKKKVKLPLATTSFMVDKPRVRKSSPLIIKKE
jgi:hypothetical protein